MGKVVERALQERVLAHPAIGCVVTHCRLKFNTLPIISPYQTYICDIWGVGLRAVGSDRIVTKERIVERG